MSTAAGSELDKTPQAPAPRRQQSTQDALAGRLRAMVPTVVTTLTAVVLALVVGALLIVFTDNRCLDALGRFDIGFVLGRVGDSYRALLAGSVGSGDALVVTLERAAPLICAGLGVSLAFRAGLFNIGAQGQLVVASIVCAYIGFTWDLPGAVLLVVAAVGAMLAGALWGGIAGVLKARTGAHEVIVTMMLNYVAMRVLDYCLLQNAFQRPGEDQPQSPKIDSSGLLPHIFGFHAGVLLAVVAATGVWWLLERSTWGFEMRAVGAGPEAARTAGMSTAKVTTLAMLLAGALAGLAAVMNIQGHNDNLSTNTGGTIGFDAITVALLGRASPVGTVLAGLLFGALSAGSVQMQASADTPPQLASVLQALIVMFVAAPALVRGIVRLRSIKREETLSVSGWGA
jgi:ABC-type uncharacterized transport system permease subunit